jgi:hypothetical protein
MMQGDRTRPKKPRPQMTETRDGNVYGRAESESESESESCMSGGGMMRKMAANSKRIIVYSSGSEAGSETTESEREENANTTRHYKATTSGNQSKRRRSKQDMETHQKTVAEQRPNSPYSPTFRPTKPNIDRYIGDTDHDKKQRY